MIGSRAILVICRKFFAFLNCLLRTCGISIALTIRSLDPSGAFKKAGAQGISIALLNQSVDRTLRIYLSNRI